MKDLLRTILLNKLLMWAFKIAPKKDKEILIACLASFFQMSSDQAKAELPKKQAELERAKAELKTAWHLLKYHIK